MTTIPAPTCHYRFPDDHRCGSPSLRGEAFCHFHHPDRTPVASPQGRRPHLTPPLDDGSLQNAIAEIIVRLAANKLDVQRARILLHSLQHAARKLTR